MNKSSIPSSSGTYHHYVFAHLVLRQVCSKNPIAFFQVMASENRDVFLKDIWRTVREMYDKEGNPGFSVADIQIDTFRIQNRPAILVRMPQPVRITEAYFVVIVLDWQFGQGQPSKDTRFDYFTLEKGMYLDGREKTVFCAWTDEMHVNYGDGPPANVQEFITAVEKKI